jgi:23S rRNA (uracil1939-C5)-methyltransferase
LAKRKKKVIENLTITGIADKGKAVGRTPEGEVVFVEDVVPGDVVDVLVLRKKKSLSQAIVQKFKHLSEDRVQPRCDHFGTCGGCKWQNLDYQVQLTHKEQTVKDCIRRIAGLNPDLVNPIIGCDSNFEYRNKLEFSFSTKRWLTKEEAESEDIIENKGALGFHKAGFFDKIVEIQKCHLQDDLSNEIRNFIRDYSLANGYSYYDMKNHVGLLRNMIVRNTTDGEWMLTIVFGENDMNKIQALMEETKNRFPEIVSLHYVINTKWNDSIYDQEVILYHGNPYITQQLNGVKYRIGPKSFFQTNPRQAQVLFDTAVRYAGLSATDNVYDLYTGLGSIALYIAGKVKHVTGIEEVPEAILDAEINKETNQITNATFYTGDVKNILNAEFIEKHGKPDIIITDPPRAGMHPEVIDVLLDSHSPRIVYISCNPATQARDLKLLSEKYDTVSVTPVDMFPHTHHIESVALLKLKSL